MRKSTKTQLNRFLKEMDKKELENEIKKLYSKFKDVKNYYEMELSGDTTAILEEHKARIKKEYFPTRGYGKARNRESKKVISDFKKISIFKKDVIDLLLYRVENMIGFTNAYGDINEAFYSSLEISFDEACKLIDEEKLQKEYSNLCKKLIHSTSHFGWGTYNKMQDSYETYFES